MKPIITTTVSDHAEPHRYPCGDEITSWSTHPYDCPRCVAAQYMTDTDRIAKAPRAWARAQTVGSEAMSKALEAALAAYDAIYLNNAVHRKVKHRAALIAAIRAFVGNVDGEPDKEIHRTWEDGCCGRDRCWLYDFKEAFLKGLEE